MLFGHSGSVRAVAAVLLIVQLPACYTWRVRSLDDLRTASSPETLRLTLASGDRVILEEGQTVGDSVVGRGLSESGRRAVGMNNVIDVAVRKLDVPITTFMLIGPVAAGVVIVGLATSDTCGSGAAASC